MAKSNKTVFYCTECGNEFGKWAGQCPACGSVGTLTEEPARKKIKGTGIGFHADNRPLSIDEITLDSEIRYGTGYDELDRVLGGGVVAGSMILLGGDPGIGKSTLLLQVCRNIAENGRKVLYVSGEESLRQIKMRAVRIGEFSGDLKLLAETSLDAIERIVDQEKPDVLVIDSIQTVYREDVDSAPGSVGQVRESTNALMHLAKVKNVSTFIVGHVTKEGTVAGPRVLEHMVDTVLYLEGDKHASYRIIRGVKNRFGSTNEIGVFEMSNEGMKQVSNPSEFMLDGREKNATGSVVTCLIEGTRPMLVEIQALVNRTAFGMPRRTAAGIDYNRVNLLMAVIEKRMGVLMSDYDAYVNAAGGIRINEPALDLALVIALLGSFRNKAAGDDIVAFGEVGLAGEVRAVSYTRQRVLEAKKLGFKKCIIPAVSVSGVCDIDGMEITGVKNINDIPLFLDNK